MALTVTLSALGSSIAHADTVVLNGFKYSSPQDVNISEVGRTIGSTSTPGPHPGQAVDVYAGEFAGLDNGKSFSAYCVDIYKYDVWHAATNYTAADLSSVFGAVKANDLGRLAAQRYASVNNAKTSAAFQMATWEILFELASTPYKLNTDTFKAVGGSAASGTVANPSAISLAQSWLDSLSTAPTIVNYDVNYLQVASGNQNLVFFTPSSSFIPSSIPEPESYALLLAGLGLLVSFAYRRNEQK